MAIEHRQRIPKPWGVAVSIAFHLPTPGRWGAFARDAWPLPTAQQCGDLDKLQRAVLDALKRSGLFDDDAQVAQLSAFKVWDGPVASGAQILIGIAFGPTKVDKGPPTWETGA